MQNKLSFRGRDVLVLIILVLVVAMFFNCYTIVPAGFAGVKTEFGKVKDVQINEGLNFKVPFTQEIHLIDCRVKKAEVTTSGASKDLQTIRSTIAVNYRVNKSLANKLYKEVGRGYEQIVIDPAIIEVSKSVISLYTAEELITKRKNVSNEMVEFLELKLDDRGIIVDDFNIINFDFSEEFNRAIEQKQTAEQLALKAERDLERIKVESQQKIEQAKAEAQSLKLQKQEITKELIELRKIEMMIKGIEKWNGILPKTVAGEGLSMFINED